MTDESTQSSAPTEPAATTTPPAQATPPQIDEDKIISSITQRVTAAAQKSVEDKVKDVFRAAAGVDEKPAPNPITLQFLQNPELVLAANNEIMEQKIEERMAQKEANNRVVQEVSSKFLEDYPDLKDNGAYVELEFQRLHAQNPKKSFKELLEDSHTNVAKKLNLKSLTEEEKEARKKQAFLPPASGMGLGFSASSGNSEKSNLDYLKARREALKAPRLKIAKAQSLNAQK